MKYSNNCGKPLTEVVVPTLHETLNLFNTLKDSGKIFRVDFTKKDGSGRTMVCRCGVKSKRTGQGAKYSFREKGLLSVWEFGNGYRSVNIDNIVCIKHGGKLYAFKDVESLPCGSYPRNMFNDHITGRTISALTSPMYKK